MNVALYLTEEEKKEMAALSLRKIYFPLWVKLVKEGDNKIKLLLWDANH